MATRRQSRLARLLLFGCITLSGCSRFSAPPKDFLRQIVDADRAVAVEFDSGAEFSRLSLGREDVSRVARAMSSARSIGNPSLATNRALKFFRGTNLVSTVGFYSDYFLVNNVWYEDRTGALRSVERNFNAETKKAKGSS